MEVRLSLLAFGFVSPWLLAGGVVLSAVPLVIHLLRRRQYVDRPWAAMQFLQAALKSQARRVRLESLVLLAVRTLLILLAAIAVSRPFLDDDSAISAAASGRLRVLVVDTSLSMSAKGSAGTALDRAQALATRIVENAPAADAFVLVQIRRVPPLEVISRVSRDRPAVLAQIRALSPTQERGDVAGALRAVAHCLRASARSLPAEVILISDFQSTNWAAAASSPSDEISELLTEVADVAEVTCVPVNSDPQRQFAVIDVVPAPGASPTSPASAVDVTIGNSGQSSANVPIEVLIGNRLAAHTSLTVPAAQAAAMHIPITASPSDGRALSVRIPEDALAPDNTRWTLLPERRPLEVLLVSGRPRTSDRRGAADFVQLALAPVLSGHREAAVATTFIGSDNLGRTDPGPYDCVFLCNVPTIDENAAARLRAYVAAGGGLVIALGDQVQPSGYKPLQSLLPGELIEIESSESSESEPLRLEPGDYGHSIIEPFAGNPDSGLLTTEIDRYWRLKLSEKTTAEVPLSYSTGDPAIIDLRVESGRVLVVTTSLDDHWSNWALWPSFVPIVHELTKAAAAGAAASHSLLVGDPLVEQFRPDEFAVSVKHQSPNGGVVDVPLTAQSSGAPLAMATALASGIHRLQAGPPRDSVTDFAVNVDPEECRLQFLDRAGITAIMPDRPFRFLSDWQPTQPAFSSGQRGGLPPILVLVVLGLLLVEQIMSFRFRIGVVALVLLSGAVLVTTVGGHGQIMAGGLAAALFSALALTLFVRTRWPARRRKHV